MISNCFRVGVQDGPALPQQADLRGGAAAGEVRQAKEEKETASGDQLSSQ